VLEKGDHQGLLRRRGVYWQMVSVFLECVEGWRLICCVVSGAGFGWVGIW
jgi:hypothetical protein